jgi:hypothetical protein
MSAVGTVPMIKVTHRTTILFDTAKKARLDSRKNRQSRRTEKKQTRTAEIIYKHHRPVNQKLVPTFRLKKYILNVNEKKKRGKRKRCLRSAWTRLLIRSPM